MQFLQVKSGNIALLLLLKQKLLVSSPDGMGTPRGQDTHTPTSADVIRSGRTFTSGTLHFDVLLFHFPQSTQIHTLSGMMQSNRPS